MHRSHRLLAPVLIPAFLLTACSAESADEDDTAEQCREYTAGASSDAVEVRGAFGATDPEATFEAPLETEGVQRTIVDEGDGETTRPGDSVSTMVTIYNGTSGQPAMSENAELTVADEQIFEAFTAGIECVPIGSRVVTVAPVADVYGDEGYPDLGLNADDSLVIVTDVVELDVPPAPAEWTENVPEVTFDQDGEPVVTLPDAEPPAELLLTVLEEGDGQEVASGDAVTLDYQGTSWDTGEVFDQSYGREPATFSTSDVVEGFEAALVGQRAGTRLLVSIPPEYGYGEDPAAAQLGGQTLVFLIEIKGVE
ncbi:FKBP-type peptidyl-prolyl cis-trans isomerase [uncultured Aeromicrobium sp.]|uniref:FKBP-type peptidyl-prolyl cis-trans isomerase n=1 Tax=uncultured Aeromicrobium sp. TaxID=337820 RepID=UPI0025DA8F50|nr:FKBP-type peptidyl-prolyl cis-trans isomerase [uncultured Aeromicrobium sp.]